MKVGKRSRRSGALVGWVVSISAPAISLAGTSFLSGSATWSWDADTASALGGKTTFTIAPPSSSVLPTSPTFQLNRNGSSGTSQATGRGSIGYVSNSTTTSWTFAGGSGAAQADPTNVFAGDTVTKVQFGGLFDVTGAGFGPTATGYFSLTVAGTAGVGGSTQVAFDMQWRRNGPSGTLLRSAISNGTTFFGGGSPTPFYATYTYASPFSPSSVSPSDNIWVGGSLTFIADNSGTPSDAVPIQFEASAAPPTATAFFNAGTGSWFDTTVWEAPNLPTQNIFSFTELNAAVPSIPNNIGDRARFIANSSTGRIITLPEDITLGSLLIDDRNSVEIVPQGGTPRAIEFDTQAHNATIHVGASAGNGEHIIATNVRLNRDIEIRAESTDPSTNLGAELNFDGSITNFGGAAGTPRNVSITGGGFINYNASNNYLGGTSVSDGGNLRVNSSGGLGTGSLTIENGTATIGTPTPFAGSGQIVVRDGGIVRLETGTLQNATVTLNGRRSGISGSPATLGALIIDSAGLTGNVFANNGGFIGHTEFDLSAAGNPVGIGFAPLHTFGVSADMVGPAQPVIVIGGESGGPWRGLGGDRGTFLFGASPTSDAQVEVVGFAELTSLGGEFKINARLVNEGTANIEVFGPGIVSLDHVDNTYTGNIFVRQGGILRINGEMPDVETITVEAGGTLGGNGSVADSFLRPSGAGGGTRGVTSSLVIVEPGGVIDPGINIFNNALGSFETDNLQLSDGAILEFEFNGPESFGGSRNDRLRVTGSLVLDGELVINQLQNFDNLGTYTIIEYFGPITDNGLVISPTSQEIFGLPASEVASIQIIPFTNGATGGVVVLVIPEPSSAIAMLAAAATLVRRRRRV